MIIAAALYVAASSLIVVWFCFGKIPQSVRRPSNSIQTILLRLFLVFIVVTLLCYLGDIAFLVPIAVLAGFLLLGWCLSEVTQSGVWNPGIIFLYIVQQFVLGFPDRDDWILPPANAETSGESSCHLQTLIGIRGETLSLLKPMGQVLVNGDRFDAISETGAFIGIEASVVVSSVNGDKLVVREISTT